MLLIHFARVNSSNEERKKDRKDIGIHIYADLATQLECVKRKIVAKDPPIILTRRISTEERYFLKKKKDSLTLNTDIVTLGTGAFFWRRKGGGNIFGQGVEGERVIELSSNRCGARRSLSLSLSSFYYFLSLFFSTTIQPGISHERSDLAERGARFILEIGVSTRATRLRFVAIVIGNNRREIIAFVPVLTFFSSLLLSFLE